jgi:hypothetical protein
VYEGGVKAGRLQMIREGGTASPVSQERNSISGERAKRRVSCRDVGWKPGRCRVEERIRTGTEFESRPTPIGRAALF